MPMLQRRIKGVEKVEVGYTIRFTKEILIKLRQRAKDRNISMNLYLSSLIAKDLE